MSLTTKKEMHSSLEFTAFLSAVAISAKEEACSPFGHHPFSFSLPSLCEGRGDRV